MPNPKSGTVTMDVAKAVKEVKQGKIDFKVDKSGIVHTSIGKVSFKKVKDGRTTTLMRYDSDSEQWIEAAELPYRYEGNRLEVIVPRKLLGLTGDGFTFDFKWSDNAYELEDPISLCLHGDTAPNRRFNYRCIWNRR